MTCVPKMRIVSQSWGIDKRYVETTGPLSSRYFAKLTGSLSSEQLRRDWSMLHNFGVSFSIIVGPLYSPLLCWSQNHDMILSPSEDDDRSIVESSQNSGRDSSWPYRSIIDVSTSRILSSLPFSRRTLTVGKSPSSLVSRPCFSMA